jgi:hypothetical protein
MEYDLNCHSSDKFQVVVKRTEMPCPGRLTKQNSLLLALNMACSCLPYAEYAMDLYHYHTSQLQGSFIPEMQHMYLSSPVCSDQVGVCLCQMMRGYFVSWPLPPNQCRSLQGGRHVQDEENDLILSGCLTPGIGGYKHHHR